MQVAGIRRIGDRVEIMEVSELRPLAGDEVLLEVMAAGVGNWDEFVRTGGWDVALAALRGTQVIATAGPASRPRVTALGARHVIDYHDQDWPAQVRALTANRGVDAAANAVPGGAASAIRAVADGGRLATITSDPPGGQRGITVSGVYVRPDGNQLRELATRMAGGQLE